MKRSFKMASGAVKYIAISIKIGSSIQVDKGGYTETQTYRT
jgi:hypothetical protein